jgi:hypothetical protein
MIFVPELETDLNQASKVSVSGLLKEFADEM